VNILAKTNEINVKKIILDKLEIICKNSNYLEEDLIEDLVKGLNTPSIEIKVKIIEIIMTGITIKTSEMVLRNFEKELTIHEDMEYLSKIIKTI
jgi:coatomer subunit beta